jgi:hypothetical protein
MISLQKQKYQQADSLENQLPVMGVEGLIGTIEDYDELIKAVKALNEKKHLF